MKFQDYYEVLGLARGADAAAIKKAYRKLALKWHPDRHQADDAKAAEAKFKRISEAYEVLSSEDKRAKYDRFGENWEQGQDFEPPPGAKSMSPEEFERRFGRGGFSDFFESVFGAQMGGGEMGGGGFQAGGAAGQHERFRHRGADIRADLPLTVSDLVTGGKRRFSLPVVKACPRCGGVGFVGEHVCPTCVGVGRVHDTKTVDLTLPSNPRSGMTMRLTGLGDPAQADGEPGDLFLRLSIVSDDTYRVLALDVEADFPVTPWEAELGGQVELVTPSGPVMLTVPAGSRAGARFRLRGKGLSQAKGAPGDFYAVLRLALPDTMTDEQRDLLTKLGQACEGAVIEGGARQGGEQR